MRAGLSYYRAAPYDQPAQVMGSLPCQPEDGAAESTEAAKNNAHPTLYGTVNSCFACAGRVRFACTIDEPHSACAEGAAEDRTGGSSNYEASGSASEGAR